LEYGFLDPSPSEFDRAWQPVVKKNTAMLTAQTRDYYFDADNCYELKIGNTTLVFMKIAKWNKLSDPQAKVPTAKLKPQTEEVMQFDDIFDDDNAVAIAQTAVSSPPGQSRIQIALNGALVAPRL